MHFERKLNILLFRKFIKEIQRKLAKKGLLLICKFYKEIQGKLG